jgi:hypothetical protein
MKVAICMRGAVSIYQDRNMFDRGSAVRPNEIYENKEYCNVEAVYRSIKKHIIKANPTCQFDFFLQGWNPDLQDKLVSLYKPKAYLFEDNRVYHDDISARCATKELFAVPSQMLANVKSINLVQGEYDMLILYRYDVLLWKDMVLSRYDVSKHMYSSGFIHPYRGKGDFHFILQPRDKYFFHTCYETLHNTPFSGFIHHWLEDMASEQGISLQKDDILPYFHQDVIRKMHPFLLKQLTEYGCTSRDIEYASKNTHIYFTEYVLWVIIICSMILSLRYNTYSRFPVYVVSFFILCFMLCYVLSFEYVIFLMVIITLLLC